MTIKAFVAAGTSFQFGPQRAAMGADGYLTFPDLDSEQEVVETLSADQANYALNVGSFPAQTSIDGTSYEATYGPAGELFVGAEVAPTPVLTTAPAFMADLPALGLTFNVPMADPTHNVDGFVIYINGEPAVPNDAGLFSAEGVVLTFDDSIPTEAVVTVEYVPSNSGTLASAAGALVGYIEPITAQEVLSL